MLRMISISGLDGSGKSTQVNLLKEYFESQGKKVFYFHAVQFSIPQILDALLRKVFASQRIETRTKAYKEKRGVIKASWLKIQLRKLALIIDLIRFKKLAKKLEEEKCDFILSDRYFYDNVINISYLENSSLQPDSYNLIPVPDFAFYLSTEPNLIMQRDRVPDQGLIYLKKKKELFDQAVKHWKLTEIDGNRDKNTIQENLRSIIFK